MTCGLDIEVDHLAASGNLNRLGTHFQLGQLDGEASMRTPKYQKLFVTTKTKDLWQIYLHLNGPTYSWVGPHCRWGRVFLICYLIVLCFLLLFLLLLFLFFLLLFSKKHVQNLRNCAFMMLGKPVGFYHAVSFEQVGPWSIRGAQGAVSNGL